MIFYSYAHLIMLPAPLSYAVVAVGLYGGFGIAFLVGTGLLQVIDSPDSPSRAARSMVCLHELRMIGGRRRTR